MANEPELLAENESQRLYLDRDNRAVLIEPLHKVEVLLPESPRVDRVVMDLGRMTVPLDLLERAMAEARARLS